MEWNKDKVVTTLLGIVAIGIIAYTLGPIAYAWFSVIRDIETRESNRNYKYVYTIPETSLFLQTYFYKDSLCTFIGNDTIIDNCSHFSVQYFPDITLVLLEVVNDSLVYLVDHNNDVKHIYSKGVTIEHISDGFYNPEFYNKEYTEKSFLNYVPKFPRLTRVSIYAGKVKVGILNDSVVSPMNIIHETMICKH